MDFKNVQLITVIGGGELMIATAKYAKEIGYEVSAILAPRHAVEMVTDGLSTEDALKKIGISVDVTIDINDWNFDNNPLVGGCRAIALCFGPAWIFTDSTIRRFSDGMFNFNGIPIPRYTGGAHFTWQILNGSYESGCFFQEITSQIDRGSILRYEYAEIPKAARTPKDYYEVNNKFGLIFLESLLDDMKSGVFFEETSYDKFLPKGLYFPRLLTRENAYIDWRWSGEEVERFCNAFDDPYPGAATFCNGLEVRLTSAIFTSSSECFHPYTYGLVLRKYDSRLWVSVKEGILNIASIKNSEGDEIIHHFREGDRFATPYESLWRSINFSVKFNSLGAKKVTSL